MSPAHASLQGVPFRERVTGRRGRTSDVGPASQQRLQDTPLPPVNTYAAGTRQACHLPPLGLQGASGHLSAPHATRIWNSSSCRRNRCTVRHRPDECTRPAQRVLVSAALGQSRVYTVGLQEHHMNETAHTVRAARHHAGLLCIATCVQRALDSGREF